jgi:hypothetical protein
MSAYVSHSRENSSTALRLCQHLSERGVDVWLDTLAIEAGQDWHETVAKAVEAAEAFVILVGPSPTPDASQRFEWQQLTEHEYYLDPTRAIVPIVLGSPEIPGFLRTRLAIAVPPSGIDFDALAARVAEALKKPDATIDQEQLGRGRDARKKALENLKEYSRNLEAEDLKRAGLRGLK